MCAGYAHVHRIHGCASTKAGQPIGNQLTHDRGESRPPPPPSPPPRGHPSECAPPRLLIDGTGKRNTHRGSIFSIDHQALISFFFSTIFLNLLSPPLSPQLGPHNRCKLLIAKRFALNCLRELVWNIGPREEDGGGVVNAVVNSLIVNRWRGKGIIETILFSVVSLNVR